MIRTIVTIEESDKRWLDRYSGRRKQSTAETIRLAIQEFQKKVQGNEYRQTLKRTSGMLKSKDDSIAFVRKMRGEWQ